MHGIYFFHTQENKEISPVLPEVSNYLFPLHNVSDKFYKDFLDKKSWTQRSYNFFLRHWHFFLTIRSGESDSTKEECFSFFVMVLCMKNKISLTFVWKFYIRICEALTQNTHSFRYILNGAEGENSILKKYSTVVLHLFLSLHIILLWEGLPWGSMES